MTENMLTEQVPYAGLGLKRGFTEIEELFLLIKACQCFIAGGYARYCLSAIPKPVQPADVDIFCRVPEAYVEIVDELKRRGAKVEFTTSNATSLKPPESWVACPKIQVINPTVMGGDPWDLLQIFDFTIAQAALVTDHAGIAAKEFEEDELGMQLRVNRIQCPIGTFKRALKYAKKGYKLSSTEMLKFYRAWDGLAPDKKEELVQLIATPRTERTPEDMEAYRRLVYID